jgi:hypothetical protein
MNAIQTDRRRPLLARTDVLLKAKLLREGAADLDIRVCNLSPAGFMAECLTPVEPGSEIILSLPGIGTLPAQVRWNVDTRIGGLFHFELSTRELGLIRNARDPERQEPPATSD